MSSCNRKNTSTKPLRVVNNIIIFFEDPVYISEEIVLNIAYLLEKENDIYIQFVEKNKIQIASNKSNKLKSIYTEIKTTLNEMGMSFKTMMALSDIPLQNKANLLYKQIKLFLTYYKFRQDLSDEKQMEKSGGAKQILIFKSLKIPSFFTFFSLNNFLKTEPEIMIKIILNEREHFYEMFFVILSEKEEYLPNAVENIKIILNNCEDVIDIKTLSPDNLEKIETYENMFHKNYVFWKTVDFELFRFSEKQAYKPKSFR